MIPIDDLGFKHGIYSHGNPDDFVSITTIGEYQEPEGVLHIFLMTYESDLGFTFAHSFSFKRHSFYSNADWKDALMKEMIHQLDHFSDRLIGFTKNEAFGERIRLQGTSWLKEKIQDYISFDKYEDMMRGQMCFRIFFNTPDGIVFSTVLRINKIDIIGKDGDKYTRERFNETLLYILRNLEMFYGYREKDETYFEPENPL